MNITPVNVALVTEAVVAQLKAADALQAVTVERAEAINEDASRCPWVGVYRTRIQYPSRTLGFGAGFRGQKIGLLIIAQQSDATSGAQCEDRLEDLVQKVLGSLLTDPSLGGVVDTLDDVTVTYPDYSRTEMGFMQMAAVYVTALTTTRASGG